jgi:hypothetical protein
MQLTYHRSISPSREANMAGSSLKTPATFAHVHLRSRVLRSGGVGLPFSRPGPASYRGPKVRKKHLWAEGGSFRPFGNATTMPIVGARLWPCFSVQESRRCRSNQHNNQIAIPVRRLRKTATSSKQIGVWAGSPQGSRRTLFLLGLLQGFLGARTVCSLFSFLRRAP